MLAGLGFRKPYFLPAAGTPLVSKIVHQKGIVPNVGAVPQKKRKRVLRLGANGIAEFWY